MQAIGRPKIARAYVWLTGLVTAMVFVQGGLIASFLYKPIEDSSALTGVSGRLHRLHNRTRSGRCRGRQLFLPYRDEVAAERKGPGRWTGVEHLPWGDNRTRRSEGARLGDSFCRNSLPRSGRMNVLDQQGTWRPALFYVNLLRLRRVREQPAS